MRHYRQIYADRPDPIVFLSIVVNTSAHVYEDFGRLFFLHVYLEGSILTGELPEESEQFRFFRGSRLANLKGYHFLNSRRVSPLLNQSLVLIPEQSV
jgi:hypothetical protein